MNRKLAPDVDMVSFMTSQDHMFVSSSLLKEVARLGGNISGNGAARGRRRSLC